VAGFTGSRWFFEPYPAGQLSAQRWRSKETADRNGKPIYVSRNVRGDRVQWRSLDDISPTLVATIVALEDKRFFEHAGVSWRSLVRAAYASSTGRRQGGPTITMQLARLLAGRPKGALSKFLEIRDALRIELSTSKRDVLEMYLNLAPLGVGLTVRVHGGSTGIAKYDLS
jgi:membrane carboxypeptidase/penicillin-binding protein PbpC